MAKYVAAIDQGTTSTRFMVFDHAGMIKKNTTRSIQNQDGSNTIR